MTIPTALDCSDYIPADTVALNVLLALPIYFLFYIRVLQSVESRHTALMIIVANAITGVFGFGAIPFVIGGAALGPGSPTVAGYMAPINVRLLQEDRRTH